MPRVAATLKLLFLGLFALWATAYAGGGTPANGALASQGIHPTVLAWASQAPSTPVPVIIQVGGPLDEVESFVTARGGTVEHRLTLINALSASLPPSLLPALAAQPSVTMVTLDAPVVSTGYAIDSTRLATTFQRTIGASQLWNSGVTGKGIGVAVIDTGVSDDTYGEFADLDAVHGARVVARVSTSAASNQEDGFGHGSHVANTIGGYGYKTYGEYAGVAPQASLIAVKIDDDQGNSSVSDVIAGLGFVFDNRVTYNIRVVNLSLSSTIAQSYKVDPLDAAVELLWFNGITVVTAAGNSPMAYQYAPANDPFIITVGATNDQGTASHGDDVVAAWSSAGVTLDGFAKPDIYAPGVGITAAMSPSTLIATTYPGGIVATDNNVVRFRMSGTSMATAVVSGAAALLLQKDPSLTPGQVKQALIDGSVALPASGDRQVFIPASLGRTPVDASGGLVPNYLLLDAAGACDPAIAGIGDCTLEFEKISWGSIAFNKISWSKISWAKISWSKISWGSVDYNKISWSKISWGGMPG